jgi:hypothetical protein
MYASVLPSFDSKMISTIAIALLCFSSFDSIHGSIYLYHTDNGQAVQFYDYFYIGELFYCRRPESPVDLQRPHVSVDCVVNGGRLHSFADLRRSTGINQSNILHRWKSGVDMFEQLESGQIDGHMCECHHVRAFGKYCEYRLPAGETPQQSLEWQLRMRNNSGDAIQRYGDIVCYRTYDYYSGLLCLDWREICDGVQ